MAFGFYINTFVIISRIFIVFIVLVQYFLNACLSIGIIFGVHNLGFIILFVIKVSTNMLIGVYIHVSGTYMTI